jgi:hypothetical protein
MFHLSQPVTEIIFSKLREWDDVTWNHCAYSRKSGQMVHSRLSWICTIIPSDIIPFPKLTDDHFSDWLSSTGSSASLTSHTTNTTTELTVTFSLFSRRALISLLEKRQPSRAKCVLNRSSMHAGHNKEMMTTRRVVNERGMSTPTLVEILYM